MTETKGIKTMKLTLDITCNGYDIARQLHVFLGAMGFHAGVSSPSNGVYAVVVTCRPDGVNIGSDMFDELRQAHDRANEWFEALQSREVA